MSKEDIIHKIRQEFPKIKLINFRHVTHGLDHCIAVIDNKIVFRMPREDKYRKELPHEIALLNYLKKRVRVGIPKYSFVSKDKTLAGYDLLAGKELTVSRFKRLTVSEKEIIAKQLASFFTVLHKTQSKFIKKFHIRTRPKSWLKVRHKKLINSTKSILLSHLSKEEGKLIQNYFVELNNLSNQDYRHALIHGDIKPEHILWDHKKKKVNIIDFSDRVFDDPARDFTWLHAYGQKFVKDVFVLYKGHKDDHFFQRSLLYYKELPLYIMKNALQEKSERFMEGYKMFKKRFGIKN